jgi:hypothetical protein
LKQKTPSVFKIFNDYQQNEGLYRQTLINNCKSIHDLNGLQNLTVVGGNVEISENPDLVNLEGLNSLISTGKGLIINNNTNLTNLDALSNLTEIGFNTLAVTANISLNSIVGIESINPSTISWLYLYYNPLLSYCHISNICEFLEMSPYENYISSNADGCASSYEISAACEEVGVEDSPLNRNLRIYPNPANNAVFIETPENSGDQHLEIFNASGQQMLNKTISGISGWIDISNLPKGFYIVRFIGENKLLIGKFVKE